MPFICILKFNNTFNILTILLFTYPDKVKSGVPPNVIIDQLRDDFNYTVEKKNIITRKDVYNISSKCKLLHKYKLHDVDALSVDLQVKKISRKPFQSHINV